MKVVLLDRDGTVIVDPPDERVYKVEKIKLFLDTLASLKYLADNDFSVILITNQAGIAEGLIDEEEFNFINDKVIELLKPSGIKILKTYMCPHSPKDGCICRKPNPKMINDAVKEFNLDLASVFMVGDRQSDIMAGVNAGTKTVLVETANIPVTSNEATHTSPTLLEAVKYIVSS